MHFQPIQFGGRIRKLRREHHLTQERLAVMLNVSVEHLRKIELGKRGIPVHPKAAVAGCLAMTSSAYNGTSA